MLRQTYSFAGTYTGESLQRGPSPSSSQVGKDVPELLQHTHFVGANRKGRETVFWFRKSLQKFDSESSGFRLPLYTGQCWEEHARCRQCCLQEQSTSHSSHALCPTLLGHNGLWNRLLRISKQFGVWPHAPTLSTVGCFFFFGFFFLKFGCTGTQALDFF